MDNKSKSYVKTLTQLKSEIQEKSVELETIDKTIFLRKEELAKIDNEIDTTRQLKKTLVESSVDVLQSNKQNLEVLLSRRNLLEQQLSEMDKEKLSLEIIIEQKRVEEKKPMFSFVSDILESARRNLDVILSQTRDAEEKKKDVLFEIERLSETREVLAKDIETSSTEREYLLSELDSINEQRNRVLKALAEEEVKTQSLRGYERDIRAMHKQLTDKFVQEYEKVSSRSNISV